MVGHEFFLNPLDLEPITRRLDIQLQHFRPPLTSSIHGVFHMNCPLCNTQQSYSPRTRRRGGFDAAGLKKPDISILSDEFLSEVQHLPQRNLAVELPPVLPSGRSVAGIGKMTRSILLLAGECTSLPPHT